jgi:hypothetical protein
MRRYGLPLLTLLLVTLAGCPSLSPPNLFRPGPVSVQRARAVQFDPLPETNNGPEIVGARPREAQVSAPEPVRGRFFPWNWGRQSPTSSPAPGTLTR